MSVVFSIYLDIWYSITYQCDIVVVHIYIYTYILKNMQSMGEGRSAGAAARSSSEVFQWLSATCGVIMGGEAAPHSDESCVHTCIFENMCSHVQFSSL